MKLLRCRMRPLSSCNPAMFPHLDKPVLCTSRSFCRRIRGGYWTTRGYANSRTGRLADWTTRGCHRQLCMLSFRSFGGICETATCPVLDLSSPRVAVSASCPVTYVDHWVDSPRSCFGSPFSIRRFSCTSASPDSTTLHKCVYCRTQCTAEGSVFGAVSLCSFIRLCTKCLGNRWTDLRQIHTKDVFVTALGWVWRSR